ncbi:MAG: sulfurtransferase TusA family protein, partial [Pseudomonadota bacterium]|nr:sulfurtransferase TusA family protein [Pseudomonadota bacterium]
MFLDLTKDKCPITFVKTKIALEKLKKKEKLTVRINEGEDLNSMPESLKELGFKIVNKKLYKKSIVEIIIEQI